MSQYKDAPKMSTMVTKIDTLNWQDITDHLHDKGYALIPGFLTAQQCDELKKEFDAQDGFRKTVVMERHRFGIGTYKYWDYPLPPMIQTLREQLYPRLVPIANSWGELLRLDRTFPATFAQLQSQCHTAGQTKPTPLILKYDQGGYNTLHQDLYGDVYFPIQTACFLSEPGTEYTGGEFILTQQVPRAQSKATALLPQKGDMIIFTTNFHPVKSTRGYYRAVMKHGVSEIRKGTRYVLGIIFHDALK